MRRVYSKTIASASVSLRPNSMCMVVYGTCRVVVSYLSEQSGRDLVAYVLKLIEVTGNHAEILSGPEEDARFLTGSRV